MRKIGVVANHKTVNYGTMLQALATQRALEHLGFQVETIDLSGVEQEIRNRKLQYFNSQMSKKELLDSKMPFIKKKAAKALSPNFRQALSRREGIFRQFRESSFPMSRICNNRAELTELSREYDTVLVGSDQIWLPSNIAADIFTLSFVPSEIKKIAYASSFGVSKLPQTQWETAKTFLNRLDYASVRELSGQKIVKDIAGRDIPVVCDPTILFTHEDWDEMIPAKPYMQEPYIFCYFLGNNLWQRNFIRKIKEHTGLKIVSILHMDDYIPSDKRFADVAPYDVGPVEFLNLIRNAEYVFTDSFHGTVLSILYEKNVFTFNRFSEKASGSTNTRIDSIFQITGLQERHLLSDADPMKCIHRETDFAQAHKNLEALRKKSWDYLKTALEV